MTALTIGIATDNDYEGVYRTVQALRLYQDLEDVELLVVDTLGCRRTRSFVADRGNGRYVHTTDAVGTATAKDILFQEAQGSAVLCVDPHVLLPVGVVSRLTAYYQEHPNCNDLLQGPVLYEDLKTISTHYDPVWRGEKWGTRGTDPRGRDPEAGPIEIPMQDMGLFSCRRSVWPGINPGFLGSGWEEGYIHEKIRQAGGRCLCLPWLRWTRPFTLLSDAASSVNSIDRLRNYLIGFLELGWDLAPVLAQFAGVLSIAEIAQVEAEALAVGISGAPGQTPHVRHRPLRFASHTPAGMETLPLVSCICSTYNRPPSHQHLIEEAIESFLRQTYPLKELIVMNDCPGQELICDAPGVRIVNLPERFPSLGDKHNAAVALARGELIAPWDDDDISLPWRLSLSVQHLGSADYFNPRRYWMWDSDGLHDEPKSNVGHNLSLYRRSAFDAAGGYLSVGSGVDLSLDRKFRAQVRCVGEPDGSAQDLANHELYYVYRWGVSPSHLSSAASAEERATNYRRIGTQRVEQGRFFLHPHWRVNYETAVRQHAADGVRRS